MRHALQFGLLLLVLSSAHPAFSATPPKSGPTEISLGGKGPGPHGLPSILSGVYPYYQTLKSYSFDINGSPNAQGWTTHDLTAQDGVFWHVDDFAGLAPGLYPLSDGKSMWCGVRAGTLANPAIRYAPGYGDHWTQILQSKTYNTSAPSRPVLVNLYMAFDLRDVADRLDVEYRPGTSGPWTLLGAYTGTTPYWDVFQWEGISGPGGQIQFRFVVTSDYKDSDESDEDTNGGVVLDNILVQEVETATLSFDTFETNAVGATFTPSWIGVVPAPFGNFAGLVAGAGVAQAGTPNNTGVWSFFNGSSATYACGGYPSQAAVPYTQVPGSTRLGDYLYNEVVSPLIDITVDKNNQPVDPNMGALAAEYDVYSDLHPTTNGIVFGYRWRFVVNGVLQPWTVPTFWYGNVPDWLHLSTLLSGGVPIPAGATQAQFSLLAMDYSHTGTITGTCHSQSPLFDNVTIMRMYDPVRVTNTNDSGIGSMRQAITNANSNPDFNAMVFLLDDGDPLHIDLNSPLPAITQPLWIDGFSRTGSIPNTAQFQSTNAQLKVMLNGSNAGPNANGLLFSPGSVGVVRGLAIGGFSGAGIRNECTSCIVTGCFVGLDASGNSSAPNGIGILNTSQGMDIGGPFMEERMLVSASSGDGIRVLNGGTIILNTHLGYDALGFEMANQGEGIRVLGGNNTQIGSPAVSPCTGEHTDRVWIEISNIVVDPPASGVMISQVVMEGGFIDLGYDGETPNDAGDTDSGANGLLNFPVLTSAGATTVVGDMDGLANTQHRIEFYSGDGFQARMHYLGYQNVTTNGSGHANINFSCGSITPGTIISATATVNTETSEFGPWVTSTNTAPGTPSPLVNLYDSQQQLRATVQYDAAYSAGNTFLSATTPSVVPSPGIWNVGNTPQYWDISTNVTFLGNVHVCVYYDPAQAPGPEGVLRLLHYQNGGWADVTTTVDPVNNVICGVVSSLSPFVIAKRTNATGVGDNSAPDAFALRANVPNPFNPTTTIAYDVPQSGGDVSIAIYDVSGRLVRTLVDEHRSAGRYSAQWNGDDDAGWPVASGVYFYRMQAGPFHETRKMVLLK